MRVCYEVVCTYEIDADSEEAAGRLAGSVAHSLARTGVRLLNGADGVAVLLTTTTRLKDRCSA